MVGSASVAGESHFAFPWECFERMRFDNASDVRDEVDVEDREGVCAELVAEWKCLDAEWGAGDKSNVARVALGCPIRMSIGLVGGGRSLGMTPGPALWRTSCATISGKVAQR